MSTTAIVTRALLPSGCRIAARVMFACCAACEMIVFTSAAVSALAARRSACDERKEAWTNFAGNAAYYLWNEFGGCAGIEIVAPMRLAVAVGRGRIRNV